MMPIERPQSQEVKPPSTGGKRVLVIDDEQLIHNVLDAALGRKGHQLTHAFDGEDGLLKFGPRQFDLVICDRLMPGKNGDEVVPEIKRMAPGQKVIMFASDAENIPPEEKAAIGADMYLGKPINMDLLSQVVEQLTRETV